MPQDVYSDYETRLLNKTLSEMPDMAACPNADCLFDYVRLEEDLTHGVCPQCHFRFCAFCRNEYHDGTACRSGIILSMQPNEGQLLFLFFECFISSN